MLDSLSYFIAGYLLIFGLLAGYVAFLVFEHKRLKKRGESLTSEQALNDK